MRHRAFWSPKWTFSQPQRDQLIKIIKREDNAASDFIAAIEGDVGFYLGTIQAMTENPEPTPAEARKLERDIEKLLSNLLAKMERLEPINSNYRLFDCLFFEAKIQDPRSFLSRLEEDLHTLHDELGRIRTTDSPLRRGRPANAPEIHLIFRLASRYKTLLKGKPSKSPTSRFSQIVRLTLDSAGQPKEHVDHLIEAALLSHRRNLRDDPLLG